MFIALRAADAAPPAAEAAAAEAPTQAIELAGGSLVLRAPEDWKRVKPRINFIEVELAVPAADPGDADPPATGAPAKTPEGARLTIMAAGGGVQRNLTRWVGQFQGTGAGANRDKADINHGGQVAGMPLHTIDLRGTFMESMRGPFGPKTPKPDHRLMGGILETKAHGVYYFKLIGPADVVGPQAEAFSAMLESVEVKP